jgi:hypothetical protein
MNIEARCPFCGKVSTLFVKDEQYAAYQSGMEVQRAFSDIDKFGRELIISGMCYECQEKTFHVPMKAHESLWGKRLGSCPICDAGIYENIDKHKTIDGLYQCAECYTALRYDGNDEYLSEVEEDE